jgi:hypothetical protein
VDILFAPRIGENARFALGALAIQFPPRPGNLSGVCSFLRPPSNLSLLTRAPPWVIEIGCWSGRARADVRTPSLPNWFGENTQAPARRRGRPRSPWTRAANPSNATHTDYQ